MSVSSRKLMGATAGAEFLAVEEVFQSWLYTGNGSTQTITNGIDLAGEGGLVWIKCRSVAFDHNLYDTNRGIYQYLQSHSTDPQITETDRLTAFNGDGFAIGADTRINSSATTYASWTFRQAPRFFDVVTYTGDGAASRLIPHDLGVAPGAIFFKRTDSSSNWRVYHRFDDTVSLRLNSPNQRFNNGASLWSNTSSVFEVMRGELSALDDTNINGATYVAYLFAHDPLGPSGDGSDGLIACGSYTGNGSATGPVINLGWEPQWLLVKNSSATGSWAVVDSMRGFTVGTTGGDGLLYANTSGATDNANTAYPTATGFGLESGNSFWNASGQTYIYIAIRRGPMREPTVGTEVFAIDTIGGTAPTPPTYNSGFPVDFAMQKGTHGTSGFANTRLLSGTQLVIESTAAESASASSVFDYMNGWRSYVGVDSRWYSWMFRRAPGFFDVVAYTGDGTLNPIGHNLTVNPELIIFKRRGSVQDWWVIHYATDKSLRLNTTAAGTTADASIYGPVTPTTFVPYLNTAGLTHISYHFASLPGISKVGSYTGNGSSQTINCAFTTGARFILIKRTDSTGDWYVWDTARGIVSGNDPHLSLNTTAAEVTSNDTIDPANSGFIVNQVAATNVNVNAATYIFFAVS